METNTSTLIGLVVAIVIVAGLLLSFSVIQEQNQAFDIMTFEECAAAGYPIMESYPRQCRTPDGRLFVEDTSGMSVSTFLECVNGGGTVVEGPPDSPDTCRTSDGRVFYNDTDSNQPIVANGCIVTGCSSQLCVSADEGDIMTTCEYRAEYACYREASCEQQANGKCGWTMSAKLRACLSNPPPLEGQPEAM